jgi:RimJ/RimL family protein N-acetyltransferase
MTSELRTERLLLRKWRPSDYASFAAMNADPQVMEHFPGVLTRAESDAFADNIQARFDGTGYLLWAVEVPGDADFIGFIGLSVPRFEAPFMPAVEVGWRLDRAYWGRGFATEGARAALGDGFEGHGLEEIVSFTVPANIRSRRVMERIGMTLDAAGDFDHPSLPPGHRQRRHVLYRLDRESWRALDL